MRARSIGLAFAALLVVAQDAASKSAATPSSAPTAKPGEPHANVARPAIAPKTAEPAPAATEQDKPRKHRRHARHHYKRYAHWQPFPIYWPRFHRHHTGWSRVPWFF